jgi:hypothetical protein
MEFLLIHGGSRGHSLRYELLWDGSTDGQDGDTRRLCGLIDTAELQAGPSLRRPQVGVEAAQVGAKLASSCPQVGVKLEGMNRPPTRADAGDAANRPTNGAKARISGENALRPVVASSAQ